MEKKRKLEDSKESSKRAKQESENDEFQFDVDLEQYLAMENVNIRRPAVKALDPIREPLVFQQLDLDMYERSSEPVFRMYGVTEAGNSVLVHIYGFRPYFYVNAPENATQDDCEVFRQALNKRLSGAVTKVTLERKQSVMYYSGDKKHNFFRIFFRSKADINKCARLLEGGIDAFNDGREQRYQSYESSLDFVLRFMVDTKVVGCNWIEVPAGKYELRTEQQKVSNSQIEADVHCDAFISHPAEGEWLKMAPFRILSFDIECSGREGKFPEAEADPVIQIASLLSIFGAPKPLHRNVLTLRSCAPIIGSQVEAFEDESKMLRAWKHLLVESDADIITGYNIINFDIPYLINRAAALKVNDFPFLGRLNGSLTRMKDTQMSSKAFGTHPTKDINMEGRIIFDMLQIITRDHKLRSYSLNAVSAHFLGEQKEDVHWSKITDLFNGNEETRRRIAVYCLKDAYLPQRLMDKLMSLVNYAEMARVTGIPLSYLLSRGHMIKVVSQLHRKANQLDLLIPDLKNQGQAAGPQYEGAIVIEPKRGFYDTPIATLDFASLYPSIMMAHNLCYSTLIVPSELPKLGLSPEQYTKTPSGEYFVKSGVRRGVLPVILDELLQARKKAKKELAEEKDPFRKAVLDGRQLALKISANAVYGFTGAQVGKLPCTEIASSVTAFGRDMIEHTKVTVEAKYTTANGYESDATVVYGDTDSVMIKFNVTTVEKAFELGKEAAKLVTESFPPPVRLEFEKVFFPYLLINKKRYAGLLWTKTHKYDKMDAKGIETVRRDNCPLVGNVINTCLQKILIERDIPGAIDYTKSVISDLLCNRLDLSLLVITKELTKSGEDYAAKQAHVELAERIRKRDPGSAPAIGDRIPFVIIKAAKNAKAYEKSEDPIYVLENNLPLDTQYYLEHILEPPVTRIFEGIMDKPQSLFAGEHMRTIIVATPTVGGIMKFAKKTITCMGCKTALKDNETTVCSHCEEREGQIYTKTVANVRKLEKTFAEVWTQCQRCTGMLHQDVLCTSRDCPIFYMRRKVQKDLKDAQQLLDRFQF